MPKHSESEIRTAIQQTAKRLRDYSKMDRKKSEDYARKTYVEQERKKRDQK